MAILVFIIKGGDFFASLWAIFLLGAGILVTVFSMRHPRFMAKRLGYGAAVLVLVVLIISAIIYLAPVDPAKIFFGENYSIEELERKRKEVGLDQPLPIQLAMYLNDVSPISKHLDNEPNAEKYNYTRLIPLGKDVLVLKMPYLRESFQSGRLVSELIWERIPRTAILAFTSISIALIIGLILGIIASLRQNSWFDNIAVVTSVLGYSLPSYVTGIIVAIIFGHYLSPWTGLNLQGGIVDFSEDLETLGQEIYVWKNLILPAIALGIRPVALITQLTRSTMLEVLSEDYIRTAKSKGLSYYTVIVKHALRNALNPVITAASGWFAALLAGAFFIENVFNYNGLGLLTVKALLEFDSPVVLGCVLFTAITFVTINILIDILYAYLDPRVSVSE